MRLLITESSALEEVYPYFYLCNLTLLLCSIYLYRSCEYIFIIIYLFKKKLNLRS